jgi:hypothetical protein
MYFFFLIQIPDPSFPPLALALCLCILGVFNGRCLLSRNLFKSLLPPGESEGNPVFDFA